MLGILSSFGKAMARTAAQQGPSMTARIAILLDHSGLHDSRVARQAGTLKAAGYDVTVFCLNPDETATDVMHDGVLYVQCFLNAENTVPVLSGLARRFRPRPLHTIDAPSGPTVQSNAEVGSAKRTLGALFSFSNALKAVSPAVIAYRPDIIHAHDLNMLPAGVALCKQMNCKLVYDSHEYERSRNSNPGAGEHRVRMYNERRAIARADCVITVSDSIADALARTYNLDRPSVILNTPQPYKIPKSETVTRKTYDLPAGVKVGIYIGTMSRGRGIEEALQSLTEISDLHIAIMGPATASRRSQISDYACALGVSERCHILPAASDADITSIIKLCDFCWIPIQKTCLSYDFALPNKLFQSYEAGLPIFSTPLFEISQFIEYFGCGAVAKGFDGSAQAAALAQFLPKLIEFKQSRRRAEDYQHYRFETMSARFLQLYSQVLSEDFPLQGSPFLPHYKPSGSLKTGRAN